MLGNIVFLWYTKRVEGVDMEKTYYDVIVIGAGNGGLVSALTLQKKGKKVLLLEKGRVPGGFASSFIRGRFEFEASLHELCEYGSEENPGEVFEVFKRLGIQDKLHTKVIPETFSVYSLDDKECYEMPVGEEAFIEKMESYVPNSRESMKLFFDLCREVKKAFAYFAETKGHPKTEVLMEQFPRFMVIAPYSVEKVLSKIHMPRKAMDILETYWSYLGSPASKLSFAHYASMIYSYITLGPVILEETSHEISLMLSQEFTNSGGEIRYLTAVKEIVVENNQVTGLITSDSEHFFTSHIIANISPTNVYGKMIKEELVPSKAKSLVNMHELGAKGICVYLGLNKSMKELGLKNYTYFIYHTLDSDEEFKRMHHLFSGNVVATLKDESEDTSILNLTSLVFKDGFDRLVTKENYFQIKEEIANSLITSFEQATGVSIRESIEEIEIATPVTFARYGGHPDGAIYGYLAEGLDNLLPRMMNEEQEIFIKGLRFCGGFGSRLSGYSSSYINGEQEALKTLGEMSNE